MCCVLFGCFIACVCVVDVLVCFPCVSACACYFVFFCVGVLSLCVVCAFVSCS